MKTVITNNGLNIMNQTRADGTVQYWIGYFGLAYVPDENRVSESDNAPSDPLSADMTELTKTGDMIYNLFQGAMTPVGLDTDIGESAAYNLFNECMYTGSVISKFRYVLDPVTNANKLIVLESVTEDGHPVEGDDIPYGLQTYSEYFGVGGKTDENVDVTTSELPIPAPLYYRGEPVAWDAGVTFSDTVSSDTRIISKSPNWDSGDKYSWNASKDFTYGSPEDSYHYLTSFEQAQSVSNFNRFHAGANVNGYAVDYEPACRNLAFATKLFPISHYDVISTTDDEHVANVKYTVEVDFDEVFSKITRQSTAYFENGQKLDPVTDKDKLAKYKLGFKFNRIGLYAVPVTLHAYNSNTADNQSKNKYNIQMQIAGNSKPRLFAVRDLSSPIVLSEDGMHKCVFNFQLNVSDTGIVDESGIYYNLYESDAITWYKNQLIANASAAEAVTTLGVEINYLRQQIADMSGENTACGVGDDGDRYALEGHTHNYLKNIVDSVKTGNGAVRGIYTQPESGNHIVVYKRNGRQLVWDENDPTVARYWNDPTATVPKLLDTTNCIVGDFSMGLGDNSATLGKLSVNMSENGVIGNSAQQILLLGGKTVTDDGLNDHVCVTDSSNSIIVASDTTEIEKLQSSLWIGSSNTNVTNRDIYIDHDVANTIGVGRVSVFNRIDDPLNPIYPTMPSTKIEYSILSGGLNMYGWSQYSLIFGDGERGNSMAAGYADLVAAIDVTNTYSGSSGSIDISNSVQYGGISTSFISGIKNKIGRNIVSTLALGNLNQMLFGVTNSVIIGNGNNSGYRPMIGNTVAPQRAPTKVFTVDEFNARYGASVVADDDHYFDNCYSDGTTRYDQAIVVGTGTISAMNKQGSVTFTREVKGACLYISYGRYKYDVDTHTYIVNDDADWACAFIPQACPDCLTSTVLPGTQINNMLMIGDYNNVAQKSHNTIVIGDDCVSPNITYKNCFISDAESRRVHDSWSSNQYNSPAGSFNNVWWIGRQTSTSAPYATGLKTSGDSMQHRDSVNFITERWKGYNQSQIREFCDVFAFVGRNPYQYGYADWYGAGNGYESGWSDYSGADLYQPCKAPMIYSGGIALGGYGTPDSNFMLLKIGMRGCWSADTGNTSNRGGEHEPNMYTPSLNQVRNIVYLQDDVPTDTPDKVVNAEGKFDLYDNYCSDGIHHLQVDSPFAGMALVVQDKQELDGTLHIGLGKPAGNGAGRAVITDFNPLSGKAYGGEAGATWSLNHPDWGTAGEDHTYIYKGWKDKHMDKVLAYRPTLTDFIAPVDDMQREHTGTCSLQWYDDYPGFNFEDGITVLDWYFWYAISDYYYTTEDSKTYYHEQWMLNGRQHLNINMNSLKEGVVYEVNLHVVRVNGPDSSTIGDEAQGTNATYRRQASPVSKQFDGSHIDADIFYDPYIGFRSYTTKSYTGSCSVHHWGATDVTSSDDIKPTFYPVTDPNSGAVDSEQAQHQLTELARAKMLFTRIGNNVYIMEY